MLFHRDRHTTVILNPAGSSLWRLLKTPCTCSALADTLAASHPDLSYDKALGDVSAFIESLMVHGMVELWG
ncbi:PqqD family protein [Synechococcus sp. CBW1004]|uniref:PqqD family protein n=1 Tax=Synechococcus sp. CBW1004 TaxID=1353136 RepID=UPI0018CE4EF1|nr:PqqD family protein [Synechococcus sp. CBW1004]